MLDCCPRCRYSLVGLPTHHRCPECGLEIERDARLFEPSRRSWKLMGTICCLAAAVWGIGAVLGKDVWHMCRAVFWLLLSVVFFMGSRRSGRAILVSQYTIRIIDRDTEPEVYDTCDVGQATWSFVNGAVTIRRTDGTVLTVVAQTFLSSNRQAQRLAATIQAQLDRVQQKAQQDAACDGHPDASGGAPCPGDWKLAAGAVPRERRQGRQRRQG